MEGSKKGSISYCIQNRFVLLMLLDILIQIFSDIFNYQRLY